MQQTEQLNSIYHFWVFLFTKIMQCDKVQISYVFIF